MVKPQPTGLVGLACMVMAGGAWLLALEFCALEAAQSFGDAARCRGEVPPKLDPLPVSLGCGNRAVAGRAPWAVWSAGDPKSRPCLAPPMRRTISRKKGPVRRNRVDCLERTAWPAPSSGRRAGPAAFAGNVLHPRGLDDSDQGELVALGLSSEPFVSGREVEGDESGGLSSRWRIEPWGS